MWEVINYNQWINILFGDWVEDFYINSINDIYDDIEFDLQCGLLNTWDFPMDSGICDDPDIITYANWSSNWYNYWKKTLTIPANYDNPLPTLPLGIKIINFEKYKGRAKYHFFSVFNQDIDDLPHGITHLSLSECYNLPVDNLPVSLLYLKFGFRFNQLVRLLPCNLDHLIFGYEFDQEVNNLPINLTKLIFGHKFNQSINNLPSSLTQLTLGYKFNQYECLGKLSPNIKIYGFDPSSPQINILLNNINCQTKYSIKLTGFYNYFEDDPDFVWYNCRKLKLLPITNLSFNVDSIIIDLDYEHYYRDYKKILTHIKKIPWGCKLYDRANKEITEEILNNNEEEKEDSE